MSVRTLERAKLVAVIAAVVVTGIAAFVWLFPEDTTTVRATNGEWMGVDCSGDEPVVRAFDPEPVRASDARAACDQVDAAAEDTQLGWGIATVVVWLAAYSLTRLKPRYRPAMGGFSRPGAGR